MAENDKRIESLEDEVKVLKGEVKRTLVDLRALLMREDSPLNEGGMARRAAAAAKPPAAEPPVQKEVVREAVQQAVAAAPPAAPEPKPAPAPPPPVAATPPPRPEPVPAAIPPAPPPPPAPIARPAFVATSGPGPGPEEEDRPRKRSKREDEDRDDGRREEPEVPVRPAPPSLALPWSPGPEIRPSDTRLPRTREKEEELQQPRRRQEEDRPPMRASSTRNSQDMDRDQDEEETTPTRGSAGSRVFEEYWELLDEATVQSAAADAAGGSPVDVNVIASLVYWVATARQRLGDEKLKELLELYLQSGHSRPGLEELLMHLHSVVEPVAPAPGVAAQGNLEWVDLMFQLHGILTGGLPIGRMPAVTLASKPPDVPGPVAATPAPPVAKPEPSPGPRNRATPPPVVAVE